MSGQRLELIMEHDGEWREEIFLKLTMKQQ